MGAVEFFADHAQLTLLELTDGESAPPVGGADDGRVHQLQHGTLAEGVRDDLRATSFLEKEPVLRQNFAGGQVGEPSALIRRQSQLDDHPPAPPASPPPVPLRRPPPARPGEPRLAPAARRVQENDDPAETTHS